MGAGVRRLGRVGTGRRRDYEGSSRGPRWRSSRGIVRGRGRRGKGELAAGKRGSAEAHGRGALQRQERTSSGCLLRTHWWSGVAGLERTLARRRPGQILRRLIEFLLQPGGLELMV